MKFHQIKGIPNKIRDEIAKQNWAFCQVRWGYVYLAENQVDSFSYALSDLVRNMLKEGKLNIYDLGAVDLP